MNSNEARKLFAIHANAMAYVDVEAPNGKRSIGSAFHIGEGVFVTARHVVEGLRVLEVRVTEPVPVDTKEFFGKHSPGPISDENIASYEATMLKATGFRPMFKHYLEPLKIAEGPFFPSHENLDVAVFRVADIHKAAGVIKLGVHWDDWVYRTIWQMSDAVVLGYPPIPMTNGPALVAARAEVHTYVQLRHTPGIHFLLSATPRGGFSGGVALHESGIALGVITSALVNADEPEQLGFFAVLSIEEIVRCLEAHGLLPDIQRQYQEELMGLRRKPDSE